MPVAGKTIIEEVKRRLDIVDIIGSRVELRRAGRNFKTVCPFHQEKTPSFVVFPDRQTYHCFGCGKSGDVISFLMETDSLDFKEALHQLADRAGVRYEVAKPVPAEQTQQHQRLLDLNRLLARYYNHLLMKSDEAAAARAYLTGRGLERGAWEEWRLGYAPAAWDSALRFLSQRQYTREEMLSLGVILEGKAGGHYDRFRGRIIFPINDAEGNTVGFGGRALGDDTPKYLNSPESPLFQKSEQLYGLDLAATHIQSAGLAVVVEGYVDAITAHTHGFRNVTATLGTALTPAHVRRISRLTKRICLALDADAAGESAALRGWEVIRESLQRRSLPIRSRGRTVAAGSAAELDVRIARLPQGEDPDSLIRRDPNAWKAAVDGALPVIDHFFSIAEQAPDASTPEARARTLSELAPVVADLGNPIERAQYESRLARLVSLDEREVHFEVSRSRNTGRRAASPEFASVTAVAIEDMILALLLRYPRLLAELPPDALALMERSQNRELLARMRAVAPEELDAEALLEGMEGPLREHAIVLISLVQMQPELLTNEQGEELRRRLAMIRRRRVRELVQQHSLLLKEAKEMGDEEAVRDLLQCVPSLISEIREFDPPRSPYFKDSRE